MQINVHEFTLISSEAATIKITGSDPSIHQYPTAVFRALAVTEAKDLTGADWELELSQHVQVLPGETYVVNLIKL